LAEGATLPLTLVFEEAGAVEITVPILAIRGEGAFGRMNRRAFLVLAASGAALGAAPVAAEPPTPPKFPAPLGTMALELVDLHADMEGMVGEEVRGAHAVLAVRILGDARHDLDSLGRIDDRALHLDEHRWAAWMDAVISRSSQSCRSRGGAPRSPLSLCPRRHADLPRHRLATRDRPSTRVARPSPDGILRSRFVRGNAPARRFTDFRAVLVRAG
jgi:hypothetical protein